MDDMIGRKFGRWEVKEKVEKRGYHTYYKCLCVCGNEKEIRATALRSGRTLSCGCLSRLIASLRKGEENANWKGGKHVCCEAGYIRVRKPDHPKANQGYVHEHILVAESVLGKRMPPKSCVHHYAETKNNNKIVICQDAAYHNLLHVRTRAYRACGNVNYRKCTFCKQYDKPENLFISHSDTYRYYHKKCKNDYQNKRRANLRTKCL